MSAMSGSTYTTCFHFSLCSCLEGIGGRKCEYCLAGFYSFPQCRECDCDRYGTTEAICDPTTSYCMCKVRRVSHNH